MPFYFLWGLGCPPLGAGVGAAQLATWQMLYCGGSQPVVNALDDIYRKYGIKLRIEKFDW